MSMLTGGGGGGDSVRGIYTYKNDNGPTQSLGIENNA